MNAAKVLELQNRVVELERQIIALARRVAEMERGERERPAERTDRVWPTRNDWYWEVR